MLTDEVIKTQKVTQFLWYTWNAELQVPDLSPASLSASVLRTIEDATEDAANNLIAASKYKDEKKGEDYEGPNSLKEMFELAFYYLDESGLKSMKKVYATVLKEYYTVVFKDPTGTYPDFYAYASPVMYFDLENLVKMQAPINIEGHANELEARMERVRRNICTFSKGVPICRYPVSCTTMCKYWEAPEEGNPYQCYYHARNPKQDKVEEGLLCTCEEAVVELKEQADAAAASKE